MSVEQRIGDFHAELIGVNREDARHDDGPFNEIKSVLQHKVLFELDQDVFHADYLASVLRFGVLDER